MWALSSIENDWFSFSAYRASAMRAVKSTENDR